MRHTRWLAGFLMVGALAWAQDQTQDAAQDPPSRVGRLNYLSGSVSFRPGTVDEWTAATLNYPLYEGDRLWTDRDARTEIHIGSTALRMGPETALAVLDLDDRIVQLSLTGGSLHVRLRELGEGESFEVDTPNGATTLLRAGEYFFTVDEQRDETTVTVRGGDAEIVGGGRAMVVHARESARLSGSDDRFTGDVQQAPLAASFEIWCQDRDIREEQSQSVQHISRETIGYEDLDSAGSWSEAPDYGWVWAPRVNAGWAPYREGRWAWVEPWGWTWIDAAPWGFAPFHYGRWAMYRGSWVWVPGARVARPVYAPALVAFVGGPGGGLTIALGGGLQGVGWFPLGPHEIYRPAYRHSDRYIRQVNVTTINVTNINVDNVRYMNQNAGSVTVVSRDVFVGARPVRNAHMTVGGDAIARGRVFGSTAALAPERTSVLVHTQAANARPPARFERRTVVVRQAPPPPPVSFAARREALQANPGRPLDRGTAEGLRRNEAPRPTEYRQAPARTMAPAVRETPRSERAPRQTEGPRVQEAPRVEQPRQIERPRQVDAPRVEQPRQVERPRQMERPRPAEAPRVEQPRQQRQEQRTERKQQARPERKGETKKEVIKKENKQ